MSAGLRKVVLGMTALFLVLVLCAPGISAVDSFASGYIPSPTTNSYTSGSMPSSSPYSYTSSYSPSVSSTSSSGTTPVREEVQEQQVNTEIEGNMEQMNETQENKEAVNQTQETPQDIPVVEDVPDEPQVINLEVQKGKSNAPGQAHKLHRISK